MINRNQLALFFAVAEEGGFGRGARRLRISQPAVSIQISQLEDALGVRLFDRVGRTIRLTDAGERLAAYARRIAALESEAAQAMADYSAARAGRVRIGASTTIAAYLLPQLMCDFRARWPGITLEMEIGNSAQIRERLLDGTLDLGLTEGVEAHPQIDAQAFRDDQLVPIVSWNHPILSARRPTLKAFLKSPLIMREPGSGTRDAIAKFLAAKGCGSDAAYSFGSTESVKGAVAAGMGVSWVSSLTIAGDVMLKRLAVATLSDAKAIRRPFYALRIASKTDSPGVSAFLSIVRSR